VPTSATQFLLNCIVERSQFTADRVLIDAGALHLSGHGQNCLFPVALDCRRLMDARMPTPRTGTSMLCNVVSD
jgi:hypothetical protein